MRYKIIEKVSGEVIAMRELVMTERRPDGKTWTQWERLPGQFLCWEDARCYVQELKEIEKLDGIKREEIVNV